MSNEIDLSDAKTLLVFCRQGSAGFVEDAISFTNEDIKKRDGAYPFAVSEDGNVSDRYLSYVFSVRGHADHLLELTVALSDMSHVRFELR